MRFIGQIRQENNQNQPATAVWWLSVGLLSAVAVMAMLPTSPAFAAASAENDTVSDTPGSSTPVQLVNSPLLPTLDYDRKSDYELTRLGARWDELSVPERQALLKEVKLRMAQRKDADGVLMIRTQHRYGRVYRGNGRYLKIETKVVRVRPAGGATKSAGTTGFGVGYEQRNSTPEPDRPSAQQAGDAITPPLDTADVKPPVVRVSDPSS